ncbi:sensory rhodopsin transducer [Salsuginibacillus kocurii]|uniref:sensory rhodopsin transducer n=1 Tax=Salsuginibacillus kocurii TaxID=427078 RepID=UPI00036565C4|nr:sensory rhodopsin transducer [Salsuginibacillus kocurii]
MTTKYKGETQWIIPDGYIPPKSRGKLTSHEAICALNLTDKKATLTITAYFEDRDPLTNIQVDVGGKRTNHIQTNTLKNENGSIPAGVPYALEVESDVPIFVQYSRLDATQPELALMSTMAVSPAAK